MNTLTLDQTFVPIDAVRDAARVLGTIFGIDGDALLANKKARGTQEETCLRRVLCHGLSKPMRKPGELEDTAAHAPLGLNLTQDQIKTILGVNDRGTIAAGVAAIEEQIIYPEVSLPLSRIYAATAEVVELAGLIRNREAKPEKEAIGWRRSKVWASVLALGRIMRLADPDSAHDEDMRAVERDLARDAAQAAKTAKAAERAYKLHHRARTTRDKKIAKSAARILAEIPKPNSNLSPAILKKSQAALDAVRRDPTLSEMLGKLEVAGPGAVALSGTRNFARCDKALRGNALDLSLFFKGTKTKVSEITNRLRQLFPAAQISYCEYGEGKGGWRAYALISA